MLFKPGFIGLGDLPLELVSEVVLGDGTTTNTVTVSDASVGAGFSTRRLVYVMAGATREGTHPTSLTIGGIAATKIGYKVLNTAGYRAEGSIFMANVPTGTTVDIVKTGGSGSDQRHAHRLYVLKGGDLEATPTEWEDTSVSGAPSVSTTLAANSFTVGAIGHVQIAPLTQRRLLSFSWTGLTEDEDSVTAISQGGTNNYYGGGIASRSDVTAPGATTVTATPITFNGEILGSMALAVVNIV